MAGKATFPINLTSDNLPYLKPTLDRNTFCKITMLTSQRKVTYINLTNDNLLYLKRTPKRNTFRKITS